MSTLHIIASLVGYIGAFLLFVQTVLGSRHIFSFFTKDTVAVNKVHKIIGMYGTLLVFSHPLFEMMWREDSFLWIFIPQFSNQIETYISFGRFALFLLIILWFTSAILRESIRWRPWKYFHLMAYPIVFLIFLHTPAVGTFFYEYLWIKILWYTFLAAFVLSLIYRVILWGGFGKAKNTLLAKDLQGDSLLLLTLSFPASIKTPSIGQHIYLQTKRFGSEHPFTVMEVDEEKRSLSFGMRLGGPFVNSLQEKEIGAEFMIDGPYGVFTREGWNQEEKVIIAGGVGVTPFVRLVKAYGKNSTLLYCNKSTLDAIQRKTLQKNVSIYRDVVESAVEGDDKDVILGRLDGPMISSLLGENKLKKAPFFICGSPIFISVMRKMLHELGVPRNHVFFEELGF